MPLKIVFMGTPDFAVESLKAILASKHEIVGVITAPDKEAGRGKEMHSSAVKKFALQNNLPLYQPERLKNADFLSQLATLNADVGVVVAFRMLPKEVWQMPLKGTFNLHASLLPNYRGAAPINHAIMNGEQFSGVSTFFLDDKIDTGKVIFQEKVFISNVKTASELHDELMTVGAGLVVKTLDSLELNQIEPISQDVLLTNFTELHEAPKIFKEHCKINWNASAQTTYNQIRGLSSYPAAFTSVVNSEGKIFGLKVFVSHIVPFTGDAPNPSSVHSDNMNFLGFACTDAYIYIDELQLEGKKRMKVQEFLRGFKLA